LHLPWRHGLCLEVEREQGQEEDCAGKGHVGPPSFILAALPRLASEWDPRRGSGGVW
jgi:hypothetical protein